MSRLPTSNLTRKPSSVLALRREGTSWRFLIAATSSGAIRISDSGTFPAADTKTLDTLSQKAGGTRVVVLPADAVVIRPVSTDIKLDGPADQVAGTLNLLAEAELPSTVPPHRRCAGVLRVGAGQGVYTMAWMNDADTLAGSRIAPAPACLAALHRLTGATDGLAVSCDETSGTVLLAACGEHDGRRRVLARVLRDDPTDDVSWGRVVSEAVDEARGDLHLEPPVTVSDSLSLPRMPMATFGLAGGDSKKSLSEFGLLLGAAHLVLMGQPDEQPLLSMSELSPIVKRSIVSRIVDGLASPSRVAAVACVCVLALLAGWIAAAPIHLAILKSRAGNDTTDYQKATEQQEWYKVLRDRRWPMTNIVAELTAQAPQGITIESMVMDFGRPISLGGTAPDSDALNQWRAALKSNKVFDDVQWSSPDEASTPVRFTLTAKVVEPMLAGGAELKAIPASIANADSSTTTPEENPRDRGTRSNRGNNNGNGNRSNGNTPAQAPTAATTKVEIPGPLTDSAIASLNKAKTTIEWAKRKGRVEDASLDQETRDRLRRELEQLEARRQQLMKEAP